MANNNNSKSSGGMPFYMVAPSQLKSGKQFIEPKSGGKFDITTEVGLINPQDNNRYVAVRFVNGKMLPGTIVIDKSVKEYTFEDVVPSKNTGVELVLCLVKNQDIDYGTKPVVIGKDKFKPLTPPVFIAKKTIDVKVSRPGSNGKHSVVISLFDQNGSPATGTVEITATQKFLAGHTRCDGYCEVEVKNPVGMTILIKPLMYNEGFSFTNTNSMETVTETLLGGK